MTTARPVLPPPPPPPGGPGMRRSNPLVFVVPAVVVVLVLGAVLGVVVFQVVDQQKDHDRFMERHAVADTLGAVRMLADAIDVERNAAAMGILGMEGVIDLPVQDDAIARDETDDAVTRFDAAVEDLPEQMRSAYLRDPDVQDELNDIRAEVDATTGPGNFSQLPVALEVYGSYAAAVRGILDLHSQAVLTFDADDADVRRGARMHSSAVRAGERREEVVFQLVMSSTESESDGIDATDVEEAARLVAEYAEAREEVVARADGSGFEQLVEPHILDPDPFEETVMSALETGVVDIPTLLDSAAASGPGGWSGLAADIESHLRQED